MSAADAVTVAIDVEVAPDVAFDVEAGVGGRLVHVPDGAPERAFVVGRVETWEPPRHLAFTWRLAGFAPDQVTRVDVRFDPAEDGTRVSITHSGWDTIPLPHPARHGLTDRAFVLWKGQWWADLLTSVKRHIEGRTPAGKDTR